MGDVLSFTKRYFSYTEGLSDPKTANPLCVIQAMIEDNRNYVIREGFSPKMFELHTDRDWNQVQLWKIIKILAEKGEIDFNETILSIFDGNFSFFLKLKNKIKIKRKIKIKIKCKNKIKIKCKLNKN